MNSTGLQQSKPPSVVDIDLWSEEMQAIWVPIAIYWVYSSIFELIMRAEIPFFEKYRIHTPEERNKRNKVSFKKVLLMVALQHIIQFAVAVYLFRPVDPQIKELERQTRLAATTRHLAVMLSWFGYDDRNNKLGLASTLATFLRSVALPAFQFLAAMTIMDFHQYVLHRLGHTNKFLYKHFHSHHHRLHVPFAFGALYNHPVEGFMLDTVGGALAYELTGMSPFLAMVFYTFSNLKTIGDHCGYSFPWDPLTVCFGNNVIYHDIHHQPYGIKKNFSQPFFTIWDRVFGTEFTEKDAQALAKRKAAQVS
ncbi:fatty acid hydroxylase superfamily-domain-containing protein [Phycomyces blakesleeanus]|uniref:Fatty acid hydroxylase superfamily-domain-containing protein n=2 Tax=Phycomyces blakesleeanus TaxID=4837 RepID=A0ABR3BCW7_PHYBL